MSDSRSQFSLTPQERRTVVIIFLVVIVVLDWMFVWPHFGDWSSINRQLEDMRRKEETFQHAIQQDRDPTNGWMKQVALLSRQQGGSVAEYPVDPQVQLQNTIREQERKTGVYVQHFDPGSVRTNNEFFEEHSTTITVESQEPQLINFLYNMGNDSAKITVAKLDLKPVDANRYRLKGGITLTANYARKPAAPASDATAPKTPRGAKPAVPAPGKPGAAPVPAPPGKRPSGGPAAPAAGKNPPPGAKPVPLPKPMPKPGPGKNAAS